jgi:uncharacterized protein (TIGR01777 family)
MRIAITGSHGLIGSALLTRLEGEGHTVVRVPRGAVEPATLEGADAIVHLAGAGIGDHRWTDSYKAEILGSRVQGTTALAKTIHDLQNKPRVLLSGSAVGWYGPRGDEILDETSPSGTGFLADVCRQWEAATAPAEAAGVRTVHVRTGIVLAAKGGALRKQLPLFKLGLGGRFGSGKQWQSWISIDDEVGAIVHLLTADVEGPVNLTAPNPVTAAEFASTLGTVLRRPSFLPVPSVGPKLLLGKEAAEELLFAGQRVVPAKLTATGYSFAYPELARALAALVHRSPN